MHYMPNNCPETVRFLTKYSPTVGWKVVYWKLPMPHYFKCNTHGDSKGNPRPSSVALCVSDDQGNPIYTVGKRIGVSNS